MQNHDITYVIALQNEIISYIHYCFLRFKFKFVSIPLCNQGKFVISYFALTQKTPTFYESKLRIIFKYFVLFFS